MATINSALGLSLADNASESLGSANTVYVSVPDTSTTCANLGLPTLPSGYSYHCSTAATSTYRRTDGTGWIPVNLSANTFGSSMAQLPQDPVNVTSSRLYYTYETDGLGRYEATTPFESSKYKLGGTSDQISGDGGTLASVYEKGSKLGMEPLDYGDPSLVGLWTFDEGTGSVAYDYSGNNATGSWNGTPTGTAGFYSPGRIGGWAGSFNGTNDGIGIGGVSAFSGTLTVSFWMNPVDNTSRSILNRGNWCGTGGFRIDSSGPGGGLKYFYMYQSTFGAFQMTSSPVVGLWNYITLVQNGAALTLNFYLNGQPNNSTTLPTGFKDFLNTLYIGTGDPGCGLSSYYSGLIDDVRIYNRALSASEVSALYNGGK